MQNEFEDAYEMVTRAKRLCGIDRPNDEMSDEEIRVVMRWLGGHNLDAKAGASGIILGNLDWGLMLTLTALVFPDFYNRYHLSPPPN